MIDGIWKGSYLTSFWKDDGEFEVIDDHVVKDVVEKSHVQHVTVASPLAVQVLVGGHIVP